MKKICLITCYMGPLPGYFGYYMVSCKKNADVDFIVINDSINESRTDRNVELIRMDLVGFNKLASEKLNTKIELKSAWKINEIKPLFGIILKERLSLYDHWGWCDLDIIWGRLRHFLSDATLEKYDVITSKKNWTAGHFTLFRNSEVCNHLYSRNTSIIELLNDSTYYAFEESCHRWNGELFSFEALSEKKLPLSMFDIVKDAEAKGEIKAHFKDVIREHPQPVNYRYRSSALTDLSNGEEFMYYHLITVKKIWRFYIPVYKNESDYNTLVMSPYGIRSENDNKLVWMIKRTYSCFLGIKKSVRTQSKKDLLKKLFRLKNTNSTTV